MRLWHGSLENRSVVPNCLPDQEKTAECVWKIKYVEESFQRADQ